ncbi:MAG: tolB protein precursor [Bacteroidetes bacterium]|jgi:Tol biopolymer transport system component|nr:tolB protein precursor [Bacteroidota bacterium]
MKKNIVLCLLLVATLTQAQNYFGRNKPGYKSFDYEVYETPNFNIYHYFTNDSILNQLALSTEQWYDIHQRVFRDTFDQRNPIIFYQNHLDFQQTNAIMGNIGIGTGGVTEALKNRVIMPVTESFAQTDHVLGHELVHAFQYNALLQRDSLGLQDVGNIPLWMVEGMAEYLSIGSEDAHTAMWMRDAILSNDFPTLDDLTRSSKYFPYRFGHAFWSFVTKIWGDTIIRPLFKETAKYGYDRALVRTVGTNAKSVSNMWKIATQNHYSKYMPDTSYKTFGDTLIDRRNAGDINIAPSISPNGKYIAFYSEKEGLSVDLYLARSANGEVIKRLSKRVRGGHIDALNFIENAGTWSPDSKKFAFVAQSKGKNKLIIVNTSDGKVVSERFIEGIPSFNNPQWHPSENKIVFSVLHEGYSNLLLYDLDTEEYEFLTQNRFATLQPNWSEDGNKIVFSTDQPQTDVQKLHTHFNYNLAIYHMNTREVEILPVFKGADNLNPVFSADGSTIFFLSDADGFRNMFEYNLSENKVYRKTTLYRGICGITMLAPAMSIASETNQIIYNYYSGGKYTIYKATLDDLQNIEVPIDSVNKEAAALPPLTDDYYNIVDHSLANREPLKYENKDTFEWKPYHPEFQLDYIGNAGGGVGISHSQFGTGVHGGVSALFSDVTGNNMLFTSAAINGELVDFGGQVAYMNQKGRLDWGAVISHIPYRSGYQGLIDSIGTMDVNGEVDTSYYSHYKLYLLRTFQTGISSFAYLPISRTRRLELSGSAHWYYYRLDIQTSHYVDGFFRGTERQKNVDEFNLPSYNVQNINVAFVEDNSYFGIASPLRGMRYRAQVSKSLGDIRYYSVLTDFRKYFRISPITFAIRAYHYGRYDIRGRKGLLNPIYLGYPWYVRGYETSAFTRADQPDQNDVSLNDLYGNSVALANFEVRLPFSGPEKLTLIKSRLILTELNLFADAGMVYNKPRQDDERLPFGYGNLSSQTSETFISSAGLSVRFNLFGYMIIEPYYAFPFQLHAGKEGYFGLNFISGW